MGECVRLCHRRLPRASHRPSSCPPVRISWLGILANERTHTRERVPPITNGRWPSRAIFAHSNCHILRARAYCNLHLLVLSRSSAKSLADYSISFWSLNRTRKLGQIDSSHIESFLLKRLNETWNLNNKEISLNIKIFFFSINCREKIISIDLNDGVNERGGGCWSTWFDRLKIHACGIAGGHLLRVHPPIVYRQVQLRSAGYGDVIPGAPCAKPCTACYLFIYPWNHA